MNKGFTLIDVLVGVALLGIVFMGIFGSYQVGLRVLAQSRDRVTATSVAHGYIERVKNLPYEDVGVQGQFPDGIFLTTETVNKNGIAYVVHTDVDFIDHAADGLLSAGDACGNDFKRVVVTVAWSGKSQGEVSLATDVAPLNDIQECAVTGGKLAFTVFDALGVPIGGATVAIDDVDSTVFDSCVTDSNGECNRLLPESPLGGTENYKIVVSKSGYSEVETFRLGDLYNGYAIATPDPANATIIDGQVTQMSFSIDRVSTVAVTTQSSRGGTDFLDVFDNSGQIAASNHIDVTNGMAQLEFAGGSYASAGDLTSITIGPAAAWEEITSTSTIPASTEIKLSVFWHDGVDWVLIPDSDLPGNSAGFTSSLIDISGLNASTYPFIRLSASLSTSDISKTPQLDEWQVKYYTLNSFPISNVNMRVRGTKTVGQDAASNFIYKYDQALTTDGLGRITLSNMEWDLYAFSSFNQSGTPLDVDEINPPTHPISVLPNSSSSADFYLSAQNSLLVTVREVGPLLPVFSANVRLSSASGYDRTQSTNIQGQTLFIPLNTELYDIEVTAPGYDPYQDQVNVSGDVTADIGIVKNPD